MNEVILRFHKEFHVTEGRSWSALIFGQKIYLILYTSLRNLTTHTVIDISDTAQKVEDQMRIILQVSSFLSLLWLAQ